MLERNVDYKVKGYTNRWSVIDQAHGFSLLENNTYGDETCYLLVRTKSVPKNREYTRKRDGEKIMLPTIEAKVYETYDDIETAMSDYDLR